MAKIAKLEAKISIIRWRKAIALPILLAACAFHSAGLLSGAAMEKLTGRIAKFICRVEIQEART